MYFTTLKQLSIIHLDTLYKFLGEPEQERKREIKSRYIAYGKTKSSFVACAARKSDLLYQFIELAKRI